MAFALVWPIGAMAGGDGLGICYREDAAPFSYIDDTGVPAGYTIDLCKQVAATVEGEPRMIEVTSQNRFDLLEAGTCDLLCEATTVTMQRREFAEFSLITFLTGSALLYPEDMRSGEKSSDPLRVGYLRGSTVEIQKKAGKIIGGDSAEFDFVAFDNHEDAQTALDSGNLESYIADREILNLMLDNSPKLAETHRVTTKSITYEPYAIAVRLGDSDLRLRTDRVLADLFKQPQVMRAMLQKHIPDRSRDPLLEDLFEIQSIPE